MSVDNSKLVKFSDINWINIIILPNFINNLSKYTLKEVSILSKLIRLKLKPVLFKNIKFDGEEFKKYFCSGKNLLWGSFVYNHYINIRGTGNGFNDFPYKDLKIASSLMEFEEQLSKSSPFVKIFDLSYASSAGYYLFQLIYLFENLTILKLADCTIPIKRFSDLSISLKKLEYIQLYHVTFAKPPSLQFTLGDIKFSNTLKELSILTCKTSSNELLLNPNSFLFRRANIISTIDFILPQTTIPSLLKFKYQSYYTNDRSLSLFLHNNPQLEYLEIQSTCIDQFTINYIEKSQNLKTLKLGRIKVDQDITTPALKSIENINFRHFNTSLYPIIQNLCLSSPNLKTLTFKLYSNQALSNIIQNIAKDITAKCFSLTDLILDINGDTTETLNLNAFYNVPSLTVKSELVTILNIDFSKSNILKCVYMYYIDTKRNAYKIEYKFSSFKNWKFHYSLGFIKACRV